MTQQDNRKGFSGLQVFGIAVLVMLVAVVGTILRPGPGFSPVLLNRWF